MRRRFLWLVLVCLPSVMQAQEAETTRLFASKSLKCSFPHGADDEVHRGLAGWGGSGAEREASGYRRLRTAMIAAERRAIIRLRDEGAIGDEVLRRVQRDLDLETMLLESGEDDAPESPYDTL